MAPAPRTPEEEQRWRDALALLDDLIDLPEAARRAALDALDDPDQRALLDAWLGGHARDAGVLDQDIVAHYAAPSLQGRQLGRWTLEQEIGRGGMAVVWRGVSTAPPVGQQAAIKILSLAALSQHGGAERFVQEQQLLSRMRHPGIAALFDAGLADDGTPWYAMALVDGERIDDWCARRGLDLRARIDLLLHVCEAVAYAHRNLVIHRDIKPSNVLVDDDGHVRLMDFGIARLTEELDTERTATALRLLTPEYAAPEQFAGAQASTAMDVYGLGALLYRLLTGLPPRKGVPGAGTRTLPPSRAVQVDEARTTQEREQLARRLRGDLDTIAMKALATEPEQRYASVDALADDLRRWRDTRPIRARAPSLRYRASRFIARNRWGVAAALALAVALTAGVAGIVWQGEQARRQAERAEMTQQFLRDVFAEATPLHRGGRASDIAGVLRDAARQARPRFATRPEMQIETLRLVGELQALNGDNIGAESSLRDVHRLQQARDDDWGDARRNGVLSLASVLTALGRPDEVHDLLQTWLDTDRPRGELGPRHCRGHAMLAGATPSLEQGRAALESVAAACLRLPAASPERIAVVAALSNLRRQTGEVGAGLDLVEQEMASLPPVSTLSDSAFVEHMRLVAELAHGLRWRRELVPAEAAVREVLEAAEVRVGKDSPLLSQLLQTQAGILNRLDRTQEAYAAQRRALALIESHGQVQYRALLASLLLDLGVSAHLSGDNASAETYWRRSMQAHEEAGMDQRTDYGTILSNLSYVLQARGAYREAAAMAGRAVAFQETHAPGVLNSIALAEFNWCMALAHAGDGVAIAHCERGAALDKQYTPADTVLIGEGQQYLADAHCLLQQWQPALEAADRAIAIMLPVEGSSAMAAQVLHLARHHRAEALAGLGRRADARRELEGLRAGDMEAESIQRARRAAGL